MAISKSDFDTWKQDQVTQAVMSSVKERATDYLAGLTGLATEDLAKVNWTRGYVFACQELLDIGYEETESND